MKKNIFVLYLVTVGFAMFACESANEPDITGKWINPEHKWGLEFRDGKVFEWEHGSINREGTFTLENKSDEEYHN
ncbi:MAG: hypothetical protein D6B27_00245 [Gammaproteobacteria bacterium]|nr:MAG: hypothetical protein D6B27_00245 [Gammaproteobacteria bacterium]